MPRVKKTQNVEIAEASKPEVEALIPSVIKTEIEKKHYIFSARFMGLKISNNTFDNMKVIVFECDSETKEEAGEKFKNTISRVFQVKDPVKHIKGLFGENIIVEEFSLNKSVTKLF